MRKPIPDVIAPGLKVLFCGVNPGLKAAAAGHHFVGRTNRFWSVLHLSGFTPAEIRPQDEQTMLACGLGLTSVVDRPTAAVSELAREEFVEAGAALRHRVRRYAPVCVAFLGKAGLAGLRGGRPVPWGRQAESFGGAITWVLPDPSGRNRAFSRDALVAAYRALRLAAEAGFGSDGETGAMREGRGPCG
jgi:double-stranded uracil-DNA glycosylase